MDKNNDYPKKHQANGSHKPSSPLNNSITVSDFSWYSPDYEYPSPRYMREEDTACSSGPSIRFIITTIAFCLAMSLIVCALFMFIGYQLGKHHAKESARRKDGENDFLHRDTEKTTLTMAETNSSNDSVSNKAMSVNSLLTKTIPALLSNTKTENQKIIDNENPPDDIDKSLSLEDLHDEFFGSVHVRQ